MRDSGHCKFNLDSAPIGMVNDDHNSSGSGDDDEISPFSKFFDWEKPKVEGDDEESRQIMLARYVSCFSLF